MNLSFRQAKNIGIGLLLSILLTLGIFSYWTMEKTVSRLSSHIENEDRMQLYADINSSLFELTDILYKFTRWEKDDLAMIPPLIKSVISKCKKLSEIDRNHSAEINHLIRNARILKMSAAAYAAELNLGYRSGSTLREMEKHFSDAAVAAIDQSERVMKKIHSESEEGNRALMLSTRKVQKVLGLIVCIGVLWGFIVAFFVSRGILRPINQLIRATSKIAGGDFEEKIPVTSSDEIGLLADSFNRMTEELNRSFAALHKESSERKRYENIVSTSSDLLSFIDKNYIYRALNRAYAEAFQKKYEDILGHSVSDVFGQELFENRIKPKIDICLNGETYQYQAWFDFPGWGKTFLDTVFHPYFGENGDVEGIVVCARNSTEYKKLEMQLVQSQKLESVGQLAAGIAHEINSPMQYISDNTYFLKNKINRLFDVIEKHEELVEALRSGTVTDELVHEVESVRKEARLEYLKEELPDAIEQSLDGQERVIKIVQSMKEFSHPGVEEKVGTDINRAIESTITIARNEWKYVADMKTDFDPGLPYVFCLSGEFNQAILNLIINAAHTISDVVGNGSNGDKGTIRISTKRNNGWAEIRVSDTGTGIPEEIRNKIFDPFFTTKEVGKGTGQGLAITHSVVVDKHGGEVSFDTETGKGTTFVIRLPIDSKEGK